jgi:hypothetical protein
MHSFSALVPWCTQSDVFLWLVVFQLKLARNILQPALQEGDDKKKKKSKLLGSQATHNCLFDQTDMAVRKISAV